MCGDHPAMQKFPVWSPERCRRPLTLTLTQCPEAGNLNFFDVVRSEGGRLLCSSYVREGHVMPKNTHDAYQYQLHCITLKIRFCSFALHATGALDMV
jgi:hypothetical protein